MKFLRWLFYLVPLTVNMLMALVMFAKAGFWSEVPLSLAVCFGIWFAWSVLAWVRHFFHLS